MKSNQMGMSFIRVGSVVCLIRNVPHALIPSVCGMLLHKELKSIVIIDDSGVKIWLITDTNDFLRKLSKKIICVCYGHNGSN